MGPPVLHDRDSDLWLSQMPAIALYLGRKHGLVRDPVLAVRLLCDASDILLEITRHHGAQMWDRESWSEFAGRRLPRWMEMHEAVARAKDADAAPALEDLALAALWHTMVDRLPPLRPLLHAHAPALEALADRVAAQPGIAALRAQWQDCPAVYCGGQIEASLLEMMGMNARI